MRPGRRYRRFGILRGIDERLTGFGPPALPAEHLEPRHSKAFERVADEIGNGAEIFGDNLGTRFLINPHEPLAQRELRPLGVGREEWLDGGILGAMVGAIKTNQVIETESVEQGRRTTCTP